MITVLLILIVLILLFGAAAVKGALGRIAGFALIVLIATFLIVGAKTLFGENGFWWLLAIVGGGLVALSLWARSDPAMSAQLKADQDRRARQKRLKKDPRFRPPDRN